jgi:hypothetical protein
MSRFVLSALKHALWPLAVVVMLLFICSGRTLAAEVLDQQNVFDSSIADSPSDAQEFAQTFTVGVSGVLSRIEVFLTKTNPQNNVILSVYNMSGGVPNAVVASASLSPAAVPGLQSFVSFDVSSFEVAVSSNDVLAFALKKDGFDGGPYIMPFTTTNTYAAGSSYRRTLSVPPGPWSIQDNRDYAFKTYVVTEETSVLQGDYNQNGTIDAADYSVWRDLFLVDDAILPNDPTPNVIDESDYEYWKDHFGESLSGPGGAAANVPEATSRTLLLIGLGIVSFAAATDGPRGRRTAWG